MANEAQDKQDETRDLGKALQYFGEIAKVGFWGALFAGVVALTGGLILRSEWGQNFVTNQFGEQGELFVNELFGMLGMDPIFEGVTRESVFLDMETSDAVEMAQSQLGDDELLLGDNLLNTALEKGKNRETTLALLEAEGFDISKPEFSVELVSSALARAIRGDAPKDSEISADDLTAYTTDALTALKKDLAAGTPELRASLLQSALNWTNETAHELTGGTIGKKTEYHEIADLLFTPEMLGALLQNYPQDSIEIFKTLTKDNKEYAMVNAFMNDNEAQLAQLLNALPEGAHPIVSQMLSRLATEEELSLSSFTDLLKNQKLQEFEGAIPALVAFIESAELQSLPDDVRTHIETGRDFLFASSDVSQKRNIDVLLALQANPALQGVAQHVMTTLSSGDFAKLETLKLAPKEAKVLSQAIIDMDFDSDEAVQLVASQLNTRPFFLQAASQGLSNESSETFVNEVNNLISDAAQSSPDDALTPELADFLQADASTLNKIREAKTEEGGMDQLVGSISISALNRKSAEIGG